MIYFTAKRGNPYFTKPLILGHGDQLTIQGRRFGIERAIQIRGDLMAAALEGGLQPGRVTQMKMASHVKKEKGSSLPLAHYDLPDLFNPLRQTAIRMHTGLESFDYTANSTVIVYFDLFDVRRQTL
jgi:hypothetical protein